MILIGSYGNGLFLEYVNLRLVVIDFILEVISIDLYDYSFSNVVSFFYCLL